ncbi:MAG: ribonuclease J [Ruminococcaceae bacterium]|nr:ribonuclease J [Oscillospiraceae bacterium]
MSEKQKQSSFAKNNKPSNDRNKGKQPKPVSGKNEHKGDSPKEQTARTTRKPNSKSSARNQSARHTPEKKRKASSAMPVHYTMLGGLNEIGKNMSVLEYGNDAFIIDCGMTFPDEDLLGVDVVLPDFSYVLKIKDKIRGIFITHGHEDHIGALPYLLKELNIPVYAGRLTVALIASKLKEHGLANKARLHVVEAGGVIHVSKDLTVEFVTVNHSIPDAMALAIKTPMGYIVHTGDFKIDCTPVMGPMIDLARFGQLGNEGVLALMADSTNVERPGYTPSERVVGESFANLFRKAYKKRIIVATFSSNLHRIQQIMTASFQDDRKVAVSGRSMINFVTIAQELGYLHVPEGLLIDIDEINRYPKERVTIITTGSQGEPMSALSRMAFSDHRKVEVGSDDYIIISATPIPGNEKTVGKVVNELMKRGCEVVYEKMYDVHVSGHACQEELKIIHGLTRPRFFIPVHGEQKHLSKHAALAYSMGMDEKDVLITDIGKTIALTADSMSVIGSVPAGRVLVDGLGVGDVGSIVLRDRKHLAEDGLIVVVAAIDSASGELVSGPDVVSRGFVYVREAESLFDEVREVARRALLDCCRNPHCDWSSMKTRVRDDLSRMLFQKTKRSPMILPIITEI